MNEAACEVSYRDEYLVALNKPSGLLVHRSPIDRHETRFALS
jgi:tRNA pseudouridine65 synthase